MDLVLWEMRWFTENTDLLRGECVFCHWLTEAVDTMSDHGVTTADLIQASAHECTGHDDALRHVVYVRSKGARGVPFTPMKGPGVVPGQRSA